MRTGLALLVAVVMVCQFGGCGGGLFSVPLDVDLGAGGELEVEAGVPSENAVQSTFNTGGVTVGSGSLRVNPDLLTVMPANANAKTLQADTCNEACDLAGVDAATCSNVCDDGELIVTVRVGLASEVETVCATGDTYGPFRVTLNENHEPVSVSPSSVTFQSKTLEALNAGSASFCLEVISPVDGTVVLDSLSLVVGL